MLTPAQAARARKGAGARLPMPWHAASDMSVYLRRGQLSMMVAAPGVGKSILANAYSVRSGVSTLYMSMDTDEITTSVRLVAIATDSTIAAAERGITRGEAWAAEALAGLGNLSLAFPSSPDPDEVASRLKAYRELMGEYPELLVLDNLGNVDYGDDEFGGMSRVLRDLQAVAVQTQTHILCLHHATGEHENGDAPIPMSGIRGKVSKFPALILTAFNSGLDRMGVSVVKNRFGPADPSGSLWFSLAADLERASLTDVNDEGMNFV